MYYNLQHIPPIETEEEYKEILAVIRKHDGEIDYKTLNEIVSEKYEGVRLRLKTMKDQKIVDFEGVVPGFSVIIKLGENAEKY